MKLSDQQKKLLRRRKTLLRETEGSTGTRLRVQLGPVVGAQLSLSMDGRVWLGCPADSILREGDIMPVSELVGHSFTSFD
jgi:hypothetical protein